MKKIPTLFIFILLCLPLFIHTDVTTPEAETTTTNNEPKAESSTEPEAPKSTHIQGGLLLPQVRKDTNFSIESNDICSATSRGKPYFMTSQTVYNEFKWMIMKPADDSQCIFRISQDYNQKNDTAYIPLLPLDSSHNVISDDGWFDCGSTAGVGKGTFKVPDEVDCDQCILEWIWKSPNSQIRQCADISVMRTQNSECVAMCQNGGICHSGGCYCPEGYTGEYCEIKRGFINNMFKGASWILFYTTLAIIFIIGIAAVVLYFKNKNESKEQALLASARKSARRDIEHQDQAVDQAAPKKVVQLAVKV